MTVSSLVSYTKFVDTQLERSQEKQEVIVFQKDGNSPEFRAARRDRFQLQRGIVELIAARRLVPRDGKRYRVVGCLRAADSAVTVMYQPELGRASFAGACVCGSVWTCPVCSARVAEIKRAEIAAAHLIHGAAGGSAQMQTFTVPHGVEDPLSALIGTRRGGVRKGLVGAMHRYRDSRAYERVCQILGHVGDIRATEITLGASGWHPHLHVLSILRCDQDDRLLIRARDLAATEWQRCCVAAGLPEPSIRRGVDFRWAWDASDYLTKIGHERVRWGADAEIALAIRKRGRGTSYGPWELARRAIEGYEVSAQAWAEFASATYGQSQVRWSRGLRAALGLGAERTDEELAREVDEDSIPIAVISRATWRRILSLTDDVRCQLLEAAEADPAHGVSTFLAALQAPIPERSSGPVQE